MPLDLRMATHTIKTLAVWSFVSLAIFAPSTAWPTVTKGSADLGFWFITNNVSNASGFLADDGVGQSYVKNNYLLFNLGLRLTSFNLFDSSSATKINAHARGRALINLKNNFYTYGVPNRSRQQMDELALEFEKIMPTTDLWIGRQTIYETGGMVIDGLRVIFSTSEKLDIGVYGGLGSDPRNFTGYIGPAYRDFPFNHRFQAGGVYLSQRGEKLKTDLALNAELFKAKLDRFSFFSQLSYSLNPKWTFSGLLHAGLTKDKGLKSIQASAISRPHSRVTNTVSFTRYASLEYEKSNSSAIPVASGLDATNFGGTSVSTSSYNSVRNHVMIRVMDRNYMFGAFQFTRRTFDDENQFKYTAGYRDPSVFGSVFDLRLQTDVIDNFRGFHTTFDTLVGTDLGEGQYRVEGGLTFYANERDPFLNNQKTTGLGQTEKEYTIRLNGYYYGFGKMSWVLNYALHNETDSTNLDQKVKSHEVYLATNFRF